MKKNGLFGQLIGEVFGTFILILLGDGVVANVGLAPALLLVVITGIPLRSAGQWLSSSPCTSLVAFPVRT